MLKPGAMLATLAALPSAALKTVLAPFCRCRVPRRPAGRIERASRRLRDRYANLRRRYANVLLYVPLAAHVVPTLVIGFGFVIPCSPIQGVNTYSLGFLGAVLGFIPAYVAGTTIARRIGKET